ncbi:MAG: GatB/YqeY domain-containing protein [Thermoleophilaceae bacterium]
MAVADQLQSDANAALKAGERERAGALRVVLSELQKAAKEGNADEVAVLQRERKRRLESALAFREGAGTSWPEPPSARPS